MFGLKKPKTNNIGFATTQKCSLTSHQVGLKSAIIPSTVVDCIIAPQIQLSNVKHKGIRGTENRCL